MLRSWWKISLALIALYIGGCAAFRALASDETRIRWVIEDMLEGFNEARLRPLMDGLSPQFVDRVSGARRADVRDALIHSFFQDVDPSTKQYLYRAALDEDSLAIEVDPEGETAAVGLSARFVELRGTEELPFWDARIEGRVQLFDGAWVWIETTAINHSDRRRMR